MNKYTLVTNGSVSDKKVYYAAAVHSVFSQGDVSDKDWTAIEVNYMNICIEICGFIMFRTTWSISRWSLSKRGHEFGRNGLISSKMGQYLIYFYVINLKNYK